jgi:hypothetical protein
VISRCSIICFETSRSIICFLFGCFFLTSGNDALPFGDVLQGGANFDLHIVNNDRHDAYAELKEGLRDILSAATAQRTAFQLASADVSAAASAAASHGGTRATNTNTNANVSSASGIIRTTNAIATGGSTTTMTRSHPGARTSVPRPPAQMPPMAMMSRVQAPVERDGDTSPPIPPAAGVIEPVGGGSGAHELLTREEMYALVEVASTACNDAIAASVGGTGVSSGGDAARDGARAADSVAGRRPAHRARRGARPLATIVDAAVAWRRPSCKFAAFLADNSAAWSVWAAEALRVGTVATTTTIDGVGVGVGVDHQDGNKGNQADGHTHAGRVGTPLIPIPIPVFVCDVPLPEGFVAVLAAAVRWPAALPAALQRAILSQTPPPQSKVATMSPHVSTMASCLAETVRRAVDSTVRFVLFALTCSFSSHPLCISLKRRFLPSISSSFAFTVFSESKPLFTVCLISSL